MATDKLVEIDHVKDFISREAALACFSDWIDRYGHEHTADEMTEFRMIEELPAADVREVVRGKWMWIEDNAYHVCSNCAGVMNYDPEKGFFIFNTLPNFCPNCGADMRGEQCSPLQNETEEADCRGAAPLAKTEREDGHG